MTISLIIAAKLIFIERTKQLTRIALLIIIVTFVAGCVYCIPESRHFLNELSTNTLDTLIRFSNYFWALLLE